MAMFWIQFFLWAEPTPDGSTVLFSLPLEAT